MGKRLFTILILSIILCSQQNLWAQSHSKKSVHPKALTEEKNTKDDPFYLLKRKLAEGRKSEGNRPQRETLVPDETPIDTTRSDEQVDTIYVYADYLDSVSVAYYAHITKKHGWMIGVGKPLSLNDAKHRSCYFRLSLKNHAGNWTRIEAFDGYGNRQTSHDIKTYLVNQYESDDLGANQEWLSRLSEVCQWEFIGDASGKNVLQERALDQYGNVVYCYNPVKTGERTYVGSYTDGNGMPVFMRTDSLGSDIGHANFVHILRDERGFDVKLSYTDRFGYPQINKDGAYQTLKEYDDVGNQTKEASLNIAGDYMIDNYGNCGWEARYENNLLVESRYFDAAGNYMQMPLLRDGSEKVYGYRYKYDEYGRNIERTVIDMDARPDTNQFGVHKVKWEFNDHGYYTYQGYYDLNDKLHSVTSDGIAQIIYEFDSFGHTKLVEYKDPLGKNVNYTEDPNDVYSRREMTFGPNYLERQTDYVVAQNGTLVKYFEYRRDASGNIVRKWYQDDIQKVDSVDTQGRSTMEVWYDLDGKIKDGPAGVHRHEVIFDDDRNMSTEIWMDKDGELVDYNEQGYSKSVSYFDDQNQIITNYQYLYGMLFQSFSKKFTDGYGDIIEQWDVTPYGEHARVGWWNNLHYVCEVDYTLDGELRTMIGKNEFGEPSYLTFLGSSEEVYYISNLNDSRRKYYDEYGMEIPDSTMSAFRETLPMAYCIEVTDTTIASPLGLRNGDIILSYGDWCVNEDLKTDMDYFYLEAILKARSAKQVTLLRHHPDQSYSEILRLNLPSGRTSDLGFYPHRIYYTSKEKARLLNVCNDFKVPLGYIPQGRDKEILLGVPIKGAVTSTRLYHLSQYSMKDPSVVLYAKEKYRNRYDTWSMLTDPVEAWEELQMFYISDSNIYFTEDICSSRHVKKSSSGYGGLRIIPVMVSDQVYNRLIVDCYDTLGDVILKDEDKTIGSSINITKKSVTGEWIYVTDDDVEIRLTIRKNGKVDISCVAKYTEELSDTGVVIDLSVFLSSDQPGSWSLSGSEMAISFDTTFTCIPKDIVITGLDDEEQESQLINLIKEMDWSETDGLAYISESLSLMTVTHLTKKHMVLNDGHEEYVFVRQ